MPREIGDRPRVDPRESPVARDIGIDQGGHAAILEPAGEFDDADLRCFGPALDRGVPVARVDADGDCPGVVRSGAAHQIGIAQGGGAEHDAVDAERQPLVDRAAVADAAAELHSQIDRGADRLDRFAVDRAAGEGAVEVDDMQPREAGFGELPSLGGGIRVEHGGARHIAAEEANAGAILEIDGRVEDHGVAGSSSRSL